MNNKNQNTGFRLALPFFITLAVLTVVSFLVFLRPSQSYMEKRELAEFPEFTWEALASGDYFDDITLWFSDTFPGREGWMKLSAQLESLHGSSAIAIQGEDPAPQIPQTEPCPSPTESASEPSVPAEGEPQPEETAPAKEESRPESTEIYLGQVIQIGESVYNKLAFEAIASDFYTEVISSFAEEVTGDGVRVISAPAPTAVGLMVDPAIMEQLGCAPQDEMLQYLHEHMDACVTTVDTYSALRDHRDEYIFFHTDHHWTALGAYYCYEALCQELELEAAPLDAFDVLDQGEFQGSLFWKASWPYKLKTDTVIAYVPRGNITAEVVNEFDYAYEIPIVKDMRQKDVGAKYVGFIAGDQALTVITNHDLPDAPSCIVVKDSFGNCFVPFLTQNYHQVIAIDYRIYYRTLSAYLEKYDHVTDIIFMPNLIATQSLEGNGYLKTLCG